MESPTGTGPRLFNPSGAGSGARGVDTGAVDRDGAVLLLSARYHAGSTRSSGAVGAAVTPIARANQTLLLTAKARLRAATGTKMTAHHLRLLRHAPENHPSFF